MSFRTTYILFALLITQIIVFALLQQFGPLPGDDLWVLPKLHRAKVKADDVTRIEIQRSEPKEKLVFVRDPDTKQWKMTSPYPTRAESHLVNQVVDEVVDARREELELPPGLAQYGLDPPETVVTLTRDNGETATLNLGKASPDNQYVYVTSSEREGAPLAVRRSNVEEIFKSAKQFRSPHGLAESSLTIASLKLDDGKHQLELVKTGDVAWEVKQPPFGAADYDGEPAPPEAEKKVITGVRELINTVEGLRVQYQPQAKPPVDDFVAENVSEADLEQKYGLGKQPTTLRIDGEVGVGSAFGVKKDDKRVKDALLIGKPADDKGEKYYARLESEPNVVRISAKGVAPLLDILRNPVALRNKDLVSGLDDARVDAIDIQNAGGVIHLRKPRGGVWKLIEDGASRDADAGAVQELLGMLTTRRQVKSFPSGSDAELGTDKGQAVVSIWQDGIAEDKDKKDSVTLKSDVPTVKLVFGNKDKDGKLVYVKREAGKDVARLTVPEGLLTRVNEGRLAYYQRSLPPLPTDELVKLTVVRDGKTFEIAKETRGAEEPVWKFLQPPEMAGRLADEVRVPEAVNDLRNMEPARWAAEKPDPAQLAEFKLAPPELKVIVTLRPFDKDNKEPPLKNYEYLFGKHDPSGALIYGKLADQNLVFLARADRVMTARGNLADTGIFKFDANKVQRLKLTAGKRLLEVGRNPDLRTEWVVHNELPDYVLDQNRLRILVKDLENLSAQRFLVYKDGPKPEHMLGDADRRLVIEIVFDPAEKKDPLTLTLGAFQDADIGVAAQSSNLPGDVFLLSDIPWNQVASDGIDYFNRAPKKPAEKKEPARDEKKAKEPAKTDSKGKEPAKDDKKAKEPAKDDKKEPAKSEKPKAEPAPEPKKAESK